MRFAVRIVCCLTLATPLSAQQVPPPRERKFTTREMQIPDTTRFEFTLENGLVGFAVREARAPRVEF